MDLEAEMLLEPLRSYALQVAGASAEIATERKEVLRQVAATIHQQLQAGSQVNLTFICTHNSRRSHLGQVWAQVALAYHGLSAERVSTFSGGTEVTACNIRTVRALRRSGLAVVAVEPTAENPRYLMQYAELEAPLQAFSKVYHQEGNPEENFVALMCCSDADQKCPIVTGATKRFALYYLDPKVADDTSEEDTCYDERCRQIAIEMFFMIGCVKEQLG